MEGIGGIAGIGGPLGRLGHIPWDVKMHSDVRTCSDTDLLGNLNCVSYQTGEVLLVQNLDCLFDSHKE
jgi:hypothetical protein